MPTTPTAASPTPRWKTTPATSQPTTAPTSYDIDVTVTDAASVAQLTSIDADNTDAGFTYTSLEDNASNLATNDGSHGRWHDVTVTDAASIARAIH